MGRVLVMLAARALHALNPLMEGCDQVKEVYQWLLGESRQEALAFYSPRFVWQVGLYDSAELKGRIQLSGGMAQRPCYCRCDSSGANMILGR